MRTNDQVIPRLLASTGRQKRSLSLLEIAEDINWLSSSLGGLSKVSDVIGISTGMLNKFLSVNKLSSKAKELVKDRKIDSVELVNKLVKFTPEEQAWISDQVLQGRLNSIDIRLLSPLRKQYPNLMLSEVVEKLIESENKRVSIIRFHSHDIQSDKESLIAKITKVIGDSELIEFKIDKEEGVIKITPEGEQKFRKAAKKQKKTFQEFIFEILK